MLELIFYSKIPELKRTICERMELSARNRVIFMLPSMSNEELLADTLRAPGGWFGDSPEIWSWSEMYARLSGRPRRVIDLPDSRLILMYILNGVLSEIESRGRKVPPGVRRRGFPDLLSSAIRELLLEDVEPDRLLRDDESTSVGACVQPRELLYEIYGDYLIYLDENGLADSSWMPSLIREAITAARPEYLNGRVLYWIGFLSFTGAQLKLIRTMSVLKEIWGIDFDMEFHSPYSGVDGFPDASRQLGLVHENQFAGGGSLARMTFSGIAGQYDGVAAEIAGLRDGSGRLSEILSKLSCEGSQSDVGIMVDPVRLPLMEAALRRFGIPFQSRSEIPVSDTIAMDLCRSAWEAYRLNWPAKRTEHLCRHPLFRVSADRGLSGRTCPDPSAVSLEMPEGLRSWIGFLSKREGEEGRAAIQNLERLNAFCCYLDDPDGHTASELLSSLLSIAGDGEWESRLSSIAGDSIDLDGIVRSVASARLKIAQKLEAAADAKPPLGPASGLRLSGPAAMNYLLDWGHSAGTALPPPRSGVVTLYGSTPPVLTTHGIWIMTDADQTRFSGSAAEHPLLGTDVRDSVNRITEDGDSHLLTTHERRKRSEALFRRLLAVGGRLTVIVRSKTDSQGRPQGDSLFLKSLLDDAESGWVEAERVEITEDLSRADSGDLSGRRRLSRGEFPRAASYPKEYMRRDASGKIRVSASSIDEWINCPFLYWCGNIASVRPPAGGVGLFDRTLQGTVMHRVWQAVWTGYAARTSREERATIQGTLLSVWDRAVSEMSADYPALRDSRFSVPLTELKADMSDAAVLQDEVEARAGAAGLVRVAAKLEYPLPACELRNISFFGRSDRIDIWRTPSGPAAVIVDYKLGRSARYLDSLQLATYAAMLTRAPESGGGMQMPVGFCYIGHSDSCLRGGFPPELELIYTKGGRRRGFDLGESIAKAVAAMDEMDTSLVSGRFPARYDSDSCDACAFQTLCRRSERSGFYDTGEEEAGVEGQDE
ncbi:MAG: PD-(D/E)XK nuclease family protein [Synergistaceae bacterium]|jgi:CRISPR/Cas system-associated exonuclease Cas4 (RecB family)|nr:PD-(D/E)XK nuclease family protein [Synergistaceae bacterium]